MNSIHSKNTIQIVIIIKLKKYFIRIFNVKFELVCLITKKIGWNLFVSILKIVWKCLAINQDLWTDFIVSILENVRLHIYIDPNTFAIVIIISHKSRWKTRVKMFNTILNYVFLFNFLRFNVVKWICFQLNMFKRKINVTINIINIKLIFK